MSNLGLIYGNIYNNNTITHYLSDIEVIDDLLVGSIKFLNITDGIKLYNKRHEYVFRPAIYGTVINNIVEVKSVKSIFAHELNDDSFKDIIKDNIISMNSSIDVLGDVFLMFKELTELPLRFRNVTGNFSCSAMYNPIYNIYQLFKRNR
jgi:hypothetical protein